jgi:hypothetical protein
MGKHMYKSRLLWHTERPSRRNLTNEQKISVWREGVDATNIHEELKRIFLVVHEVERVEPKSGKRPCFEAAEKGRNGMSR